MASADAEALLLFGVGATKTVFNQLRPATDVYYFFYCPFDRCTSSMPFGHIPKQQKKTAHFDHK